MNMPGFTADAALRHNTNDYNFRQSRDTNAGKVVPAIPACANCDWILDKCASNGWKPAGLCNLCAVGNCY